MTDPVTVGVIGCGNISSIYLENCRTSEAVSVLACADLDRERAQAQAAKFGVPRVEDVDELLDDREIEVILNLTIPAAHAEISKRALTSGKHLYSEKPLAATREDGRAVLNMAGERDLLVGCAPDTFLGAGWQTVRKLLDDGTIGRPVATSATFMSSGMESWHPAPDFFFQPGGGPLFDMGPYYLTALITLLGPVRRVSAITGISFSERTIGSAPRRGERIPVSTPTYVASVLEFSGSVLGTMTVSFDIQSHGLPHLEIYGSDGTIQAPDPNTFGGPVLVRRRGEKVTQPAHSDSPITANCRGIGLADMAVAIRQGGTYRASGELAFHVLDVMHAMYDSAETGKHVEISSTCVRPAPMPLNVRLEEI